MSRCKFLFLASLAILGLTILTLDISGKNAPFRKGSPIAPSQHTLCSETSYSGLAMAIHKSLEFNNSHATKSNLLKNCEERLAFILDDLTSVCEQTNHSDQNHTMPPRFVYEKSRRRLSVSLKNLWNYYKSSTAEMEIEKKHYEDARAYAAQMLVEIELMTKNDGHEAWRLQEAKELSSIVHKRLWRSQNPKSCSSSKVPKFFLKHQKCTR